MIATIYLHSDKDSNADLAIKLGLNDEAARMFIYACHEVKVDLDVNPETGEAKIVRVDDREVADPSINDWKFVHNDGRVYHNEHFKQYCVICLQEKKMPSVNDWAAKAARRIMSEFPPRGSRGPHEDRIAAIIATFAEPMVALLRDSRREHLHSADGDVRDGVCCPQCCCESWPDDPEGDFEPSPNSDEPCNCGADAWNARIDAVLDGNSRISDKP